MATIEVPSFLVGASFRPAEIKSLIKALEIGSELIIEAEPDNTYDPNALKLMFDTGEGEEFVGYIAKDDAAFCAFFLRNNYPYTVKVTGFAGTVKPSILISITEPETADGPA